MRRGLEEGVHLVLLLRQQERPRQGVEEVAMRKRSVGNLLALYLQRRRHSLGQTLPRHSELWNRYTLREGLLLPVHIYRSFIIQALSALSVRPRSDAQRSREYYLEQKGTLGDYIIQFPNFIGILLPVSCHSLLPILSDYFLNLNFSIYWLITIYTIQSLPPNLNSDCGCLEERLHLQWENKEKAVSLAQG